MRRGAALLAFVLGCTDDGPAASPYKCLAEGGVGCFEVPDDILYAVDGTGAVVEPVLGCGTYVVEQSPGPIAFSGTTVDLVDRDLAVGGVRLEALTNVELTAPLFDVTSDDAGAWAASLDAPGLAFVRASKPGNLDLLYLHERIDVSQPAQTMTFATATRAEVAAQIAAVGDQFLPGRSQLSAVAYDCAGNHLVNAVANVSPVSARNGSRRFETGVKVYYQDEGVAPALVRRTERHQTSRAGGFAIANLSPGEHYVQLWGFRTENDRLQEEHGLALLAEYEIHTFEGEAGVVMSMFTR